RWTTGSCPPIEFRRFPRFRRTDTKPWCNSWWGFPQFPLVTGQSAESLAAEGFSGFPHFPLPRLPDTQRPSSRKVFPPFPPTILRADGGRRVAILMNILPILSRRKSAGISHNIAQERQAKESHGCCTSGPRSRDQGLTGPSPSHADCSEFPGCKLRPLSKRQRCRNLVDPRPLPV